MTSFYTHSAVHKFIRQYDGSVVVLNNTLDPHYYKQISDARLLLTALGETVTDEDLKHNAYVTSKKHIDLKEACWDWNRSTSTTWAEMRTHVSTEILNE